MLCFDEVGAGNPIAYSITKRIAFFLDVFDWVFLLFYFDLISFLVVGSYILAGINGACLRTSALKKLLSCTGMPTSYRCNAE